jgi:diguanylate cyclase (GGDEF)-like protein
MALALDDSTPVRRRLPARGTGIVRDIGTQEARALALRRVVAEVNGTLELEAVLEDVLDSSQELFGADAAGLWQLQPRRQPFELVASRDLGQELIDVVASVYEDEDVMGLRAMRERRPIVIADPAAAPRFGPLYERLGFRTVNFVPLLFRDEHVGLLVLYHRTPYDWSPDELELCTSFANQMATAFANARLFATVREGAARLRAIQELSSRLNRIQDVEKIGDAIVAEADRLICHDTIRVYSVDPVTGMCEPIAYHGQVSGIGALNRDVLRLRTGEGLTGWVAQHNETIRLGDAGSDPRGLQLGTDDVAESMLLVPMSYESRVLGVIVVSKVGFDQFGEDDQRTLEIFAGYAAQAVVNAEAFGQVRRQQDELHHRLESQRRLLEVNERLLATLDPSGVLEMIADSLKVVVSYDALTVYRVDRGAGVRRAVLARDRYAEVILQHEGPLDAGITGWAIRTGATVLANDAHLDPRSVQIPGTPEEPESMLVCPLFGAGGDVIGTLNVARMGDADSHFSQDEFELVQLFAAQASIALRNAEAHGAVMTQAEHDALTGLRNHGAFQREVGLLIAREQPFGLLMLDLDAFKAYNDRHGHPEGDALLARIATAMAGALRDGDRVYRYGGDEFAVLLPGISGGAVREVIERVRAAVVELTQETGPTVTVSAGVALYPDDATEKDDLVAVADRALYLAKPADRLRLGIDDPTRDPYLAAIDQMTLRLLERLEPRQLLWEIVDRAAGLVGVKSGFLYLLEDIDGETELVCRVGVGLFDGLDGYRLPHGTGIGWTVVRSGRPMNVNDYGAYPNPAGGLDAQSFGAVCAVPLTSDGEVLGMIGLASGDCSRPFSERELEALARFAQLASIALDNARLFERAQIEGRQRAHAALHDMLTGLPNRTALLSRLTEHLDAPVSTDAKAQRSRVALILLDLDRFKVVNESLGHAAGDLLLAEVAHRLVSTARSTDVVARLGSDEFGVLLGPVRSVREAERVAARITAAVAVPFDLDGQEVTVGASLGLAVGRTQTTYAGDLLKEAEIALHRAKLDPVRKFVMFDPEMRAETLDRATLEHDLRRAIERSELRVHYQPLVDLETGTVVGLEALLRWQHPTRGLVPPLSFIPLAEETGLILPIGQWVLETACQQVRAWQRRFPSAQSLVISVNLSARQFAQSDLVAAVAATIHRAGLAPANLELEITESVVMDQSEASVERLRGLQALGVQLVLDDFGTGYSSLSYLRRLPLDTIKIDRSFVSGLGSDAADLPIIQAVISLAHGLGIDVVAEGIETAAQLASLRALNCDRGQGYAFARPLPPDDLEAMLARSGDAGLILEVAPAA